MAAAVFGLIVAGCSTAEPESQSKEPPTPLRTPVATDTSRPEATPTPTPEPDCEEKCQTVRAYTPVPTTTPAPPAAAYPQGTRTGVAEVDAIVAAIEARDAGKLAQLLRLTTVPCEEPRPVQPQPFVCTDGQAVGTPITGFWVTHVEGGLWRVSTDEMAKRILSVAEERGWRLHSVFSYALAGTSADYLPETDYFITFTAKQPGIGPEFDNLRVIDGKATHLHFAFPEPSSSWDNPNDPGWLLPRAR